MLIKKGPSPGHIKTLEAPNTKNIAEAIVHRGFYVIIKN